MHQQCVKYSAVVDLFSFVTRRTYNLQDVEKPIQYADVCSKILVCHALSMNHTTRSVEKLGKQHNNGLQSQLVCMY
jgi:hypothetical protein